MMNDFVLLVSRVALGASIASHGAQKQFGWFDGPGPEKAAGFFASLGFAPGKTFRDAAIASEIGGGLLTAIGLGGPIGPLVLASTMLVAGRTVHAKNGFFMQQNGYELTSTYAIAALALAAGGPGRFSLDAAFGWDDTLGEPWVLAIGVAGALAAALTILAQQQPSAQPASTNGKTEGAEPAAATT
jgi:putative oxidoreductase